MSATLDAALFADYFGRALRRADPASPPVPKLEVKGRMFPVQARRLENCRTPTIKIPKIPPPKKCARKQYYVVTLTLTLTLTLYYVVWESLTKSEGLPGN